MKKAARGYNERREQVWHTRKRQIPTPAIFVGLRMVRRTMTNTTESCGDARNAERHSALNVLWINSEEKNT